MGSWHIVRSPVCAPTVRSRKFERDSVIIELTRIALNGLSSLPLRRVLLHTGSWKVQLHRFALHDPKSITEALGSDVEHAHHKLTLLRNGAVINGEDSLVSSVGVSLYFDLEFPCWGHLRWDIL